MDYAVYLDESGTHKDAATLVVAGYLALPDEWIAFEVEWRAVLAEYSIASFHMTDFANGAPPFDGWSASRRESCFEKLLAATNRHVWGGYVVAIPLDAYRRAVGPNAHRWLGGPYGLAMTRCFFEVADTLKEVDPARQISYALEDGAHGKGQVLKVFELNKGKPELAMLALTFENRDRFVPLQAADILAYEMYRDLTRQLTGMGQRRPQYRPLFGVPMIGGKMPEDEMASWAKIAESGAIVNPHLSSKQARKLRRLFGP